MQYGPDGVPISNASVLVGPPTKSPAPIPSTTTEEIIEPPTYEPSISPVSGGGIVIPVEPPYAVSVVADGDLITSKVYELDFVGNGVSVTNQGFGRVEILINDSVGIPNIIAGPGIYVSSVGTDTMVTNTGIIGVVNGSGISINTVDGNATITNTGITGITAGSGISAVTVDGVTTITNTNPPGITSVTATQGLSSTTVSGAVTIVNTFTETVYNGGTVGGTVTPNRNNGTIQKYTLNNNITLNTPTNMSTGQSLTLILTQDSAGNHLLDANVSYLFASGFQTLSTSSGAIDMINIFFDGTTYYATLTVGYS